MPDLLDEDKPIAQQKFVCVSFLSPENILKKKEIFFFDQFVKNWDFVKSMQKYSEFTGFLSYKYNLPADQLMQDFSEFCKEENDKLSKESVLDDYKTFLDKYTDSIELEFNKQNEFRTNTRGLKIRGTYASQEEAEMRAKMLREHDPNHDVFVGPVGLWMPWDPDAYRTGKVEHLESELNQLMEKKQENEASAKEYFDKRIKETKQKAIEENKKKALETGNKLSQTIDEQGNLTKNLEEVKNTLFSKDNL